MKTDVLAAIDIGSNAVRFIVNTVDIEDGGYALRKAAYLRVPLRLGQDVFTRGGVSEESAKRFLAAMRGFAALLPAYNVSAVRACATSAMRDAENGPELVAAVEKETGIGIDIISGDEEAELVYTASGKSGDADDAALYIDVGGGSTELVVYKDKQLRFHDSFQLGTVRMLVNTTRDSRAAWDEEEERLAFCLREIHSRYKPARAVASGGNINKVHKILGKKKGEPLKIRELKNLFGELHPLSVAQRMQNFDLNDYRADVIVPALKIFLYIAKNCSSLCNIFVPKIGLADGLIHDLCKKRLAAGIYNQENPCGR